MFMFIVYQIKYYHRIYKDTIINTILLGIGEPQYNNILINICGTILLEPKAGTIQH